MKRNETSEEHKSKREENRSETKNYLISNQCFHKQKTKKKQVTTTSSDIDLQILTEESQIKKRTQTPCKNKFRVC
jgi:hypothetical protein